MTQSLAALPAGGRIDRRTPLRFTFNGKRYEGHAGDTLASALLANGVYAGRAQLEVPPPARHRRRRRRGAERASCSSKPAPRTVPNARATEVALYEGLVARSVNAGRASSFDLMAVAGLFARFMPAGFYYKTFMWPQSFWRRYEHYIRKASGLGTAPAAARSRPLRQDERPLRRAGRRAAARRDSRRRSPPAAPGRG